MRALCIFGIAGLASCSLVTSLDGFSDPGATPDNRTTSSDGGDESETAEGASPLKDAGSGNLLPRTNGGFCNDAGAALFCVDFDDGTIPSEFKVRRSGENVVMVDMGASASPPASLLLEYPVSANARVGSIEHTIGTIASELTAEFDLAVEEVGGGEALDVLRLEGTPSLGVNISKSSGVRFKTYSLDGDTIESQEIGISLSSFYHVKWVAHRDSTMIINELYVDGNKVTFETIDAPFGASVMSIGDGHIKPNKKWRVRMDNVVVTIK